MKIISMISITIIGINFSFFLLSSGEISAQGNGTYHQFDIEVDGLTREYILYVPQGHDGIEKWPLVFVFHGLCMENSLQIQVSQMYKVADTARFLLVYPQGLPTPSEGDCYGWHVPDRNPVEHDDVLFVNRMINELIANPQFALDLDRIHATGYSNGAEMSFYLACVLSHRIASVAGVAISMSDTMTNHLCVPSRLISILHMQGTEDPVVPVDGDIWYEPIEGTAEFWAGFNGCDPIPDTTYLPDINTEDNSTVTLLDYPACEGNAEVLSYHIEGGGHTWPGGWIDPTWTFLGTLNKDINASAEMWNFFKRNPRPSASMMVEIPDTAFLYALIDQGVDTNGDSLISYAEAEVIESLNVRGKHISDLTGINAFINLDTLRCGMNQFISLDVSGNSALKYLTCSGIPHYLSIPLETLNVSDNTQLEFLECMGSNLSNLVLSNNISLKYLEIYRTPLTSLDISDCDSIRTLKCKGTQITDLIVSDKPALRYLDCEGNQLSSLDVYNNTALTYLDCQGNQLTSLDVSKNTALTSLKCGGNQLINLDVSMNTALTLLDLNNTELTNLNLSNNDSLKKIYIAYSESLHQVCVWTMPFPPEGVTVDTANSPNVYFAKCSPPKAWEQMESMDIARGGMRSCVLDSMIYVFGGEPASVYASSDSSDAYNTKTNEWSDLATMPLDLLDPNTEVLDEKIYLTCGWHNIGGDNWITTNTAMEYDPEGDSWQLKKDSPEAMGGNASCVLNDTIYIMGGYNDSNPSLEKKAWYYAPGTDTWDSLPDMIYDRGIGSSADTLDNKLYVIGGIDDFVNLHGKSEVYDLKLKTWTVLADMPVPVINHISVVHDQKILVFGGDSSWTGGCQWGCSVGTNFIQEYDLSTDSWRVMEGMPFKRANMTGEKVGNYVYIIGGYLNSRDLDQPLAEVWRFNLDSLKVWEDICTEVELSGYPDSWEVDDTLALYARVLPDYTPDKSVTWSSDNQAVATVSDSGVVICKSAGTATITATSNAGGCTDSSVLHVITGFQETTEGYFSVHPNPANDLLTVDINRIGQHWIEITSLNGQLLYTARVEGSNHQINLSSFEKGLFFITVRSKDYVRTEKIIKL